MNGYSHLEWTLDSNSSINSSSNKDEDKSNSRDAEEEKEQRQAEVQREELLKRRSSTFNFVNFDIDYF